MAREKRKRSETGIYHIMLRGIDGRKIFMDDEDKQKFIQGLIRAKEKGGFTLYAYCLMNNHVHLLIKEKEEIGTSIKRIAVGYVGWHNNKYGRKGHLFQNRFKSEVVESEEYLLTVIRYIHQNPVQAKLTKTLGEYKWSSYQQYIDAYNHRNTEIDTDIIKSYFQDRDSFEGYMNQINNDKCLEYVEKKKYTDAQLTKELKRNYKIEKINTMTKEERDKLIYKIKQDTGVSIRQLSRVLGIGRGIVEKATKHDK